MGEREFPSTSLGAIPFKSKFSGVVEGTRRYTPETHVGFVCAHFLTPH